MHERLFMTHNRLPRFLIIGAMKSATSTLYEQLCRQPGIFLPSLKEPNFFSDDDQFGRGLNWYMDLFSPAAAHDLLGEASTHYTKLPTYPKTVARIRTHIASPHLIYVMRDPLDRLVSQYIHQWSEGEIQCSLDEALTTHPELVAYSCYARQLEPYIEAFGKDAILPVFFESLRRDPQRELTRICRFIGYRAEGRWISDLSRRNVSAERVRRFPLYDILVDNPAATLIRRTMVPKFVRNAVRNRLSMQQRPSMAPATRQWVEKTLNQDLSQLGAWLGVGLSCETFTAATSKPLEWAN